MGRADQFGEGHVFYASWPSLSRPSTSLVNEMKQGVDARERRQVYAVCTGQTAMPGHDGREGSAAPYRRHQHLVAPAGAAVGFLAGAGLQVPAPADPDFAEAL